MIMKLVFAFTLLLLTGFSLTSCSTLSSSMGRGHEGRQFVLESGWSRTTLKDEFFGFRRLNRMQPIVLVTMVIESNAIDGIVAFERGSGHQIWRLDLENGVEGGAAVSGDKLYFGSSDGQFYCVNLVNGSTVWTFPVRAETLAAPTFDNGVIYFQSGADVVFALDAQSGKQLWVYNRQVTTQLSIRSTTRPVVKGDMVYAGFSDGFLVALKRKEGTLLWEHKIGKGNRFHDVDATPVIDGDSMYVASFDGSLVSMKTATGDVNWTIDQGAYVPVTLGEGSRSDRLYYSTADGQILVVDKRSGKVLKTFKLQRGIPTQVALFRGLILYGESEGALVVADAETGESVASFDPGHGIVATPTVDEAKGEAYVGSVGANLYAFRLSYRRPGDRLPWQAQ
jgi:outer membrane protein assembly factor BamB